LTENGKILIGDRR